MTEAIDWAALREEARAASRRAYAPYSRFGVGAAAVADDGEIITGCNVENASYGLSLCAECGLISALHDSGGGRLIALTVVDAGGQLLSPCGRCRQLLLEAGGPALLVDTNEGPRRLDGLLPDAFSADDLDRPTQPGAQ